MSISFGFRGQSFKLSSDAGSVRFGGHGVRSCDDNSDFAAVAYDSRLQGVYTFLTSDSESTQKLVSMCIWWTLRSSVCRVTVRFVLARRIFGQNHQTLGRSSETER